MSRGRLPEGVPFDNLSGSVPADAASFAVSAPSNKIAFTAPDMATPSFQNPATTPPASPSAIAETSSPRFSRVTVEVDDDEEEDDDDKDKRSQKFGVLHGPHVSAPILILIAIGFLLAALAVYVGSQNQGPDPFCSQQPEWNQYNCRPD